MAELTFKAKCVGTRIDFYAQDYVGRKLQILDGQDVFITIKKFKPKRSIKQNNWYYGVAIPMIQHFLLDTQGEKYTKDEVNQYHLNTVIKPKLETKAIFGKVCVIYDIKRTSEMSTVEFMDFKEQVQVHWAQYELFIPDPEQTEF
jgi:hypothetical protein